jgi:hypothetical protein
MNYKNENITLRAQESHLWQTLSRQDGEVLPYLVERYLLLENWHEMEYSNNEQYLHTILAEIATVALAHEERLRQLEGRLTMRAPDRLWARAKFRLANWLINLGNRLAYGGR